jgi:predicted nuclease with RNAse H fold
VLIWYADRAEITQIEADVSDERALELISSAGAERIGLDVPLGWPNAFVEQLARHHRGEPWRELEDSSEQKSLTHRATDHWIHAQLGLWPLSVSTDRIAYPAMRMARVLGRIGQLDRSGGAQVVEVYPAAALKRWGFDAHGYKRVDGRSVLARLVEKLRMEVPWLMADEAAWDCIRQDDNQFDALICALIARAVARDLCEEIPPEHREIARIEGWIHLPLKGSLHGLLK